MSTLIRFKRSSTQDEVPLVSELELGEIAVNTYHGRIYTEKNDGTASVVEIGTNPSQLTINDAISFPTSDGTADQVLSTDGNGQLSFTTLTLGESGATSFTYTITSDTDTITGNDDGGNSLQYTAGTETVFLNGIKLVAGSDYTQTNSTTITLTDDAINGDVIEVFAITAIQNLVQGFYTNSLFTTTTADQVLSSNGLANKGVKYFITATHATEGTHCTEVLLCNDGTDAFFVQYGDVFSDASLFSLNADVNLGNMRLLITPVNTNTTVNTFQIRHS